MKCCDLTAGMLRQRIELQAEQSTPDGSGGLTTEWHTFATVRAHIKALSGAQRLQAERLESVVRYRAVIRFRDDVFANVRVLYNGRAYNVQAVWDIEERRQWLELDLAQGVAT